MELVKFSGNKFFTLKLESETRNNSAKCTATGLAFLSRDVISLAVDAVLLGSVTNTRSTLGKSPCVVWVTRCWSK